MSSKIYVFFIVLYFIFLPFSVRASVQCLSGEPGNNHLIEQFENAKKTSGITKAIIKKYGLDQIQEIQSESECSSCELNKNYIPKASRNNLQQIKKITEKKPELIFKEACINSAGQFEAVTTGEVKCPGGEISKEFNFCMTEEIYNYENAVISDFYNCVKKVTNFPLMPEDLFELYSLESGFKPHYAYSGGMGIGQLTSIYVADALAEYRGRNIITNIKKSLNKECSIAKQIIDDYLVSPPQFSDKCAFIQIGEGVERNILYTLMELANIWEKDISPKMTKFNKNNSDKENVKKAQRLSLINAYGPGGRKATLAAIRRLSIFSSEEFVEKFNKPIKTKKGKNLTTYINKINEKQDDLLPILEGKEKKEFEKNGAKSCIN